MSGSQRIAIVGGGVIGLSVAWRLARADQRVVVFDRTRAGGGAGRVAGGMVAPISEYGFEDDAFLELGADSLRQYPEHLLALSADSGIDIGFDGRGALAAAVHRDDVEAMRRVYDFRAHRGLPVEWLSGSEAREFEPLLSPRVTAGMWTADDCHIDTRKLLDALVAACRKRGVDIREDEPVTRVAVNGGRVLGVETAKGTEVTDSVVIAAGCRSADIAGIPESAIPPVRPVKGQILVLRGAPGCEFRHVIRAPEAYVVPKKDGRLLVGATQEEMGFDETPTAGPVMRLIEKAWEVLPSIYECPFESVEVGLRPGSRDHLPIIGPTAVSGLHFATGHFRHGILLSPVTAQAVCEGVTRGRYPASVKAFYPGRFSSAPARHGSEN